MSKCRYVCVYMCARARYVTLGPTFRMCLPSARWGVRGRGRGSTLGCPRPEHALLDRVTLNIRAATGMQRTRFPMPVSSRLASARVIRAMGYRVNPVSLPPTNIYVSCVSPMNVRAPSTYLVTDGMPVPLRI